MPDLGILKKVDPRLLWKNEERDFTPWIAENIDRLSQVIGIPFVIDQTEKRVGAYELDVFGHVEGSDAPVIIENQLTQTDHKHLGQLITYASGLDAALVIWIATEVTDEHRAAVLWLNKVTGDAVSFYLVRPEVLQIDESRPAVKFVVEASPSEFKRAIREAVEGEEAPRHEFRRQFWGALLNYLTLKKHSWASNRQPTKESWLQTSVGRTGVSVTMSMAMGSRMRIELYFSDDREKKFFDSLYAKRAEIELAFSAETVSWERLDEGNGSRIAVYRPYSKESVSSDTPERQEIFEWIERNVLQMRNLAKAFISDV
jgi:hypothetical protein